MIEQTPHALAQAALKFVSVGMKMLAMRILVLLAVGINAGLYIAALIQQTWLSFTVAAVYSVLVFLPTLLRDTPSARE